LRRNVFIFLRKFPGGLKDFIRHDIPRLDPTFSALFIVCLHLQPSFFLGIVRWILYVLEVQYINRVATVYFQQISRNYGRRTTDLGPTRNYNTGVVLLCECEATLGQAQNHQDQDTLANSIELNFRNSHY
jgi:hypothetical protein